MKQASVYVTPFFKKKAENIARPVCFITATVLHPQGASQILAQKFNTRNMHIFHCSAPSTPLQQHKESQRNPLSSSPPRPLALPHNKLHFPTGCSSFGAAPTRAMSTGFVPLLSRVSASATTAASREFALHSRWVHAAARPLLLVDSCS